MSGADEEWVNAAMTDDAVVVELLVRLHHATPPRPPPLKPAAFRLEWSVRQRRSKSASAYNNPKKQAHRGSPTTPLSWSGTASFSGGAACAASEESTRPTSHKLVNATRSKVNIDGDKPTSKRSRKKKTLAELKDEENALLKERRELKRELVALRVNLERQRAANENLKRMTIELEPCLALQLTSTPLHPTMSNDAASQSSSSDAILGGKAEKASESTFILPDLNIPFDEPSSTIVCGIS